MFVAKILGDINDNEINKMLCVSRQLCVLLNSKDIYLTLAQILLKEENLKFASIMVETLNTILLTSSELFQLRSQLKDLKNEVTFCHWLLTPEGWKCDMLYHEFYWWIRF